MTWSHLRGTWSTAHHILVPARARPDRPEVLQRRGDGALAIPAYRRGDWFYVVVSRKDVWACGQNWFVAKSGYVQRNANKRTEYLHRLIQALVLYPSAPETGLEPTTSVDHKNRRKLDCQRRNLVMATPAEQTRNQHRNDRKSVGVTWDPTRRRWYAKLKHNGRDHHIGRFRSRHAAIARRAEVMRKMGLAPELGTADATNPTSDTTKAAL